MRQQLEIRNRIGIVGKGTGYAIFFGLMLSIGLREGFENLTLLWRRPGLLFRCVLASFVLVPIASMAIDTVVPMGDATRAGVAVMALCPGAPMLYRKLAGMKANTAVAGSYQVTMSLLAIVFVPLWIIILNILYFKQNPSSIVTVGKQIALVQIVPITVGIMIRGWLPQLADDLLEPVVNQRVETHPVSRRPSSMIFF